MEVDGVKRVLFKIIIPVFLIAVWMITCYPVCNKAEGFDLFLFWIMVGCPFGIHRMCLWLVPKNFGISGSIGIFALNCIIGGLIGGLFFIFKVIVIVCEFVCIPINFGIKRVNYSDPFCQDSFLINLSLGGKRTFL